MTNYECGDQEATLTLFYTHRVEIVVLVVSCWRTDEARNYK
jgi:hypothetical protein